MFNLIFKSDGLVKIICAKWLTKFLKKYLGKEAKVSIKELKVSGEDDELAISFQGDIQLSKERLLQLLEKKVDTL